MRDVTNFGGLMRQIFKCARKPFCFPVASKVVEYFPTMFKQIQRGRESIEVLELFLQNVRVFGGPFEGRQVEMLGAGDNCDEREVRPRWFTISKFEQAIHQRIEMPRVDLNGYFFHFAFPIVALPIALPIVAPIVVATVSTPNNLVP